MTKKLKKNILKDSPLNEIPKKKSIKASKDWGKAFLDNLNKHVGLGTLTS